MVKNGSRLIGVVVLGLIIYALRERPWGEVLVGIKFDWIFVSFLLNIPQLWAKSIRWNLMLREGGVFYRQTASFFIYMSCLFLGIVTPGRIGELLKAIYVYKEKNTSFSHAFGATIQDRIFDLYFLLTLSFLGVAHFGLVGKITLIAWLGGACVLLAPLVALSPTFRNRIGQRIYHIVAAKLPRESDLTLSTKEFLQNLIPSSLESVSVSVILTCCSYSLYFVQCYLIALAMGIDIVTTPFQLIYAIAITNLVSFIPVSISGIGTRDAALIILFGHLSLEPEYAIVYSSLMLLVFYLGGGILGAVAYWHRPLQWGYIRDLKNSLTTRA